ncbi:MAG: NAD(P)H-dependent glycerol-3-phosphate dehydrogenase [Pseudomonadota bacterium]
MNGTMHRIAVLGAGSWGTALAIQLARVGHEVRLWTHESDHARIMQATRANHAYLPSIELQASIAPTDRIDRALDGADHVLIVTPSHAFAETLDRIRPQLKPAQGLAWATKGFEPDTGRLLSETASDRLPPDWPLAVVTGPSFAGEVAQGLPTAVTVGSNDEGFGQHWARLLHGNSFRAYYTADLIGVQLGGALKNVLAIGCGMADGLDLGHNVRAALITRGLAEMTRLGQAMGGEPRTLTGLAGLGDLVLTCTGNASRNRRMGLALGRGETVEQAMMDIGQVVEGVNAAKEAMHAAQRFKVEMPIAEQVHGILFKGWNVAKGVRVLMEREQRAELD